MATSFFGSYENGWKSDELSRHSSYSTHVQTICNLVEIVCAVFLKDWVHMNTRASLTLVLCLVFAVPTFAQQAGLASIIGVVQDPSGATIPGAKVVVSNEAKGIMRNLETNAEGIFSAPTLVPAAGYTVTVDSQGFTQFKQSGIE